MLVKRILYIKEHAQIPRSESVKILAQNTNISKLLIKVNVTNNSI